MSSATPPAHRFRILTSSYISSNHNKFHLAWIPSSMVAFGDIRAIVSAAASGHHPHPGGGVPLGHQVS